MKTIRQHLEEFPEPYRTQALENTKPSILDDEYNMPEGGVFTPLGAAFVWTFSPQEHRYWSDFNESFYQNKYDNYEPECND